MNKQELKATEFINTFMNNGRSINDAIAHAIVTTELMIQSFDGNTFMDITYIKFYQGVKEILETKKKI